MKDRFLAATGGALVTAAVVWAAAVPAAGQAPSSPAKPTGAVKAASAVNVPMQNPHEPKGKPAPRNADGRADLNGVWSFRTATPPERPKEFGTKWSGDSRGHWEGDTLVVETTNFPGPTRPAPGA